MNELQFLTEEDMKYFEDLEARGEAVILRISDEELLSMDFSKPLSNPKEEQPINQEELEQWIKDYREEFRKQYEKNQNITQENEMMRKQINENEVEEGSKKTQEVQSQSLLNLASPTRDERPASLLEDRVAQLDLGAEKAEIIADAVESGLETKRIFSLLKNSLSVEDMKELYSLLSDEEGDIH